MLTELEFSRERYRQTLMVMPYLVEEATQMAKTPAEREERINWLLDSLLRMQREIRKLERNSSK